jgi:hypothetical protein
MPIKFRCEHCRQFLGISHKKAGMLVDCPNCGRTIRVPDPEGKVQPLPDLKLNLKDSKLATALEELASLGRDDDANEELASAVEISEKLPPPEESPRVAAAVPAPPVVPVPVRIEPAVPAKPILIDAPDARPAAPVASLQELSALASVPMTRDAAAEQPVVDIEMALGRTVEERTALPRAGTSRIVIGILLGFILGFGAGRWDRRPANHAELSAGQNAASKNTAVADPFAESPKAAAVRGRITYQTDSGERRPDRGARVLLLPDKRVGSTKLTIAGFRATDSDATASADSKLAVASLRALGGDVMTVDDAGQFEATALPPGSYRILALSHFQPRDDRSPIEPETKALLESYFDKPEQLLGKCRYRLDKLTVNGTTSELWDHTFDRE